MSYLILSFILIVFMGLIIFCQSRKGITTEFLKLSLMEWFHEDWLYYVANILIVILAIAGIVFAGQVANGVLVETGNEKVAGMIFAIPFTIFFSVLIFHGIAIIVYGDKSD